MQCPGYIGYCTLNLTFGFSPLAFEFPSHIGGRLRDHLLKKMPGNVPTLSKMLGDDGIVLSPPDQMKESGLGETRADVNGDRIHYLLIAPRNQHIGNRLSDRFSQRDCKQMALAF